MASGAHAALLAANRGARINISAAVAEQYEETGQAGAAPAQPLQAQDPSLDALDPTAPVGSKITIDYGSTGTDPFDRYLAKQFLFGRKLAETEEGKSEAEKTELRAWKEAIEEEQNMPGAFQKELDLKNEHDKKLQEAAVFQMTLEEATNNVNVELVETPVTIPANTATEEQNMPDFKVLRNVRGSVSGKMSATDLDILNFFEWFGILGKALSARKVSDEGAIRLCSHFFTGILERMVTTQLQEKHPSLSVLWADLQIEVAKSRSPVMLARKLNEIRAKKPRHISKTLYQIRDLHGLLQGGHQRGNKMQTFNETRMEILGMIDRFYPEYATAIHRRDRANRSLLQKTVEEANGGQVDPKILNSLHPLNSLFRVIRDTLPEWNLVTGDEEVDHATVGALEEGQEEDEYDQWHEGEAAALYADRPQMRGGRWSRGQVSAVKYSEDDRRLRMAHLQRESWDDLAGMTVARQKQQQLGRRMEPQRGIPRSGWNHAEAAHEVAEVHGNPGMVRPQQAKAEGSFGMNAASSIARHHRSQFGGGGENEGRRMPAGGMGGSRPWSHLQNVCWACGSASHLSKFCRLYNTAAPGMPFFVPLSQTACESCKFFHQGRCLRRAVTAESPATEGRTE